MVPKEQSNRRGSALEKALQVLEAIADQPQSVGLPDLSTRLGLSRQTLHRVLQQLQENGLIIRDTHRDRFSIGPRFSSLALSALTSTNQGAPVRSILQELVDDIQETCNIGILSDMDYVYIERIECHWSLRIYLQAGSRLPAHCTAGGKVLLAHLPADVRKRLLRSTPLKRCSGNTIVDPDALEAVLERTLEQGYALSDQELSIGIVALGVPILDPSGRALAALSMHAPHARLPLDQALEHLPSMTATAKRLGDVLAP